MYTSYFLPLLALLPGPGSIVAAARQSCKATLGAEWPSLALWSILNETTGGRLLQPLPPASPCHQKHTFNSTDCQMITKSWGTFRFHQDDPISTAWNNMNNDSCIPSESAPCSGRGYPVYVVNATSAEHVKHTVDFARLNNIRLVVKASGHDYLKRSAAPFSLSIWTRYMTGSYEYHGHTFQPAGCKNTVIQTTAVTVGAGSSVDDTYTYLRAYNQTVVDGMGPEVTAGGYLTGGGHSPVSNVFGLGSDQVYQVEMVTPGGEIITANECQNEDIFWAIRGGGGSTFGVITRFTIRTVPSTPMAVYDLSVTAERGSEAFWDSITCVLAQFPVLASSGVAAFVYLYPNASAANTAGLTGDDKSSFHILFALYNPSHNSELADLINDQIHHCTGTRDDQLNITAVAKNYPNFYDMYQTFADRDGAGVDKVVGSRLLPSDVLTSPKFREALITFAASEGARLYMVAGEGVRNAKPRGGGNAVNPAWRKALIHAVASQNWTPLQQGERRTAEDSINNVQVEALRQLTPGSGAYLNEAYWNEPNFQQAFWGNHYERLDTIKKIVDPTGVFWCHTCVGSEGWIETNGVLCKK